jgi:hypothetical protein
MAVGMHAATKPQRVSVHNRIRLNLFKRNMAGSPKKITCIAAIRSDRKTAVPIVAKSTLPSLSIPTEKQTNIRKGGIHIAATAGFRKDEFAWFMFFNERKLSSTYER